MKAYRCYEINGCKEVIALEPLIGGMGIKPDEIELYLQPYCKEAVNYSDTPCIEYNGMLYFSKDLITKNNIVCIKKYHSGDITGHPTGEFVAIAAVKQKVYHKEKKHLIER